MRLSLPDKADGDKKNLIGAISALRGDGASRMLAAVSLQVVVNFRVVGECDDWLVVDKPAPLIVHPANRKPEPTLLGGVEWLLAYDIENGACPAVVNRLDRETSGLVVIAKSTVAARELGGIFTRREVDKEYLAIVNGWPEQDAWECAAPILRAGELGPSSIWVRQTVHPLGKDCVTRFAVVERFSRREGRFAVVRCRPETGRMHQIRVHLAHGGHPIAGDKIYSGNGDEYIEWMTTGWTGELARRLWLPRHALHASMLAFQWNGVKHEWMAGLPIDLAAFVAGEAVGSHPEAMLWNRHTGLAPLPGGTGG